MPFPTKKKKYAPLKKWLIPVLEGETYKMWLEYLITESKNADGLLELCQKGSGEPTWKGSLGQKWYGIIFSINKNNNFNKLKCIKYINPWVHNNMQITKNNN